LLVGISGLASGILVVSANGWMNSPTGFELIDGVFTNIDPIAALLNPAWFFQAVHMCLAAFTATGFAVAGIHAFHIIKGNRVAAHTHAFKIAIIFGAIAALVQPISGDLSAKDIAQRQPAKLAAMEAHYETATSVPLFIGGLVDEENQKVDYKIEIPGALSFLAFGDFNAEVKGLNDFPPNEIPPVAITHYAFQVMVGLGGVLILVALIYFLSFRFKKWQSSKLFWWLFVLATPMGFIALEAGWTVTEVGRQPWIIYKIMKTAEAVTPMPGIQFSAILYLLIYFFLALAIIWLMRRQITVFNQLKS
jgi:cytochrome d ubiquinol oxidase subunit I